MSFYSDASLVMIPSGYKDQKVYCAVPTDGSGDLTFSRASNATRVASNGLIEKVRTNLNLYSQDFTNAAYGTFGFGSLASVAANTTANPLTGAQDADTATFTAGGTQSRLLQQFTGLSTTNKYTYSLYVKAGTKSTVKIYGDVTVTGVVAEFNLATASVVGTPTLCTASIVSAGSGWYRCSITFNAQGAGSADCGPVSWAGEDGTLFIYGAQLEVSDFGPTDYIATTSAAVSVGPVSGLPRLDYTNSSCPRLLLEPQRTNLITYSEQFDNAAWVTFRASVTANVATSPDGYTNADKLIENTDNNSHGIFQAITNTSGQQYSVSVYAKAAERSWLIIYASGGPSQGRFFNLSNGTLGGVLGVAPNASSITNVGNGWYRCSITYTATDGSSNLSFYPSIADGTDSYAGDGTSGILVYGAQCELGSYPTSLIPTLSTSVTRVADAAQKDSITSLIGQTAGTIYWESNQLGGAQISLNTSASVYSDGVQIYASGNTLAVYIQQGGVTRLTITLGAVAEGSNFKIALAYGTNFVRAYINGVQTYTTSATIPMPTLAMLNLSFYGGGGAAAKSETKQVLLFKSILTDAQLAELTTL